ncbi:SMI1/KNR4 family protein [Mucilaginibacter myungsuensis]|uniref:Knr4/Smi1-like domain-containing protein n=1 Tax=Mucilaginibacter myungsuensis TaxID=649104 RepID=A0A929PYR5_9SPHI|nr:SMI1/KNR4 family protein [Mucilaginibacter myungsuensis]MBE9663607.1 hypothetical protein [Mucilaginibacter myungsuensis]MDN3599069.1 hypothetical protein [Mucilaginibacter myungsuensis]
MEKWVTEAIELWKADGVKLNAGSSLKELEGVERRNGFKFPDDFKILYAHVNGFEDFDSRGFMLSLWSTGRIIEENDISMDCIMFADFSLSVCQYGFEKKTGRIFKAYTHFQQGGEYLTDSFREFIDLFNSESELLF